MELSEEWRVNGHSVEHFSFSEAFPRKARGPREYALRRLKFPRRAAEFVKANAGRFDIIDALAPALCATKPELNFSGLLVARSVGSHRLYDRFERTISKRWPKSRRGTFLGKIFYSAVNRRVMAIADAAIAQADLINVPNSEEANFLRAELGELQRIVIQPYGLTDDNRAALAAGAVGVGNRFHQKRISFVGMWSPRKGSNIWAEIVRRVRQKIPEAKFRFLGTMVPPESVLADLNVKSSDGIETVPEFAPAELPVLLQDCAVGAFPSFIEGFGLAVIEQLAAGIPTVAFDQGGPRDILRDIPQLLVPVEDVAGFADRLVKTLRLSVSDYTQLSQASLRAAGRFEWWQIANDTIATYRTAFAKLSRTGGVPTAR